MQGKGYWNIIIHNAKRVMSPCEFHRRCAGDLLRDIGRIFILFQPCFLKYKGYELCVGVLLPLEFKNVTIHYQMM